MKRIPVTFIMEPLAVSPSEAARALGIGATKFWQLSNLPESDPRKIRRTSYDRVPVEELRRHVRAEMEK